MITPTAVDHDSPESYYSVSSRLAEEIPGGFKPDQYSNMANPEAHYRGTAPEIWEQTGGEIDALVISVGTGGTISGIGRYFKERSRPCRSSASTPKARSTPRERRRPPPVPRRGHRQGHLARHDRPEIVDEWIQVSDRDSFLDGAPPRARGGAARRRLLGQHGLGGAQCAQRLAADAQVLTLLPDSGRSYLSKFLDDKWMLEHGFLERSAPTPTVAELLHAKRGCRGDAGLVTIGAHRKVGEAIDVMHRYSISQLGWCATATSHARGRDRLAAGPRPARSRLQEPGRAAEDVAIAMQPPFATVEADASRGRDRHRADGRTNAVLVAAGGMPVGVVTRSDLLEYLSRTAESVTTALAALRRFVVGTAGLCRPNSSATAKDVEAEVRRLTAVQLDSISTVDRAHRIDARRGSARFDERAVSRLLAQGRIFEYWAHEACLLPIELWPHCRRVVKGDRHWGAKTTRCRRRRAVEPVLGPAQRGRCAGLRDFEGQGGGACGLEAREDGARRALGQGVLAIAERRNFQRAYDLAERVIPKQWLDTPTPTEAERCAARAARRRRRGALTEPAIREHWRLKGGKARPHHHCRARRRRAAA